VLGYALKLRDLPERLGYWLCTVPGLTACIAVNLAAPAHAETRLPPIVISAARTAERLDIPAATSVITARQIEASGARSVSELLRMVTGLHVSDGIGDGSSSRIDMRGFGATAQSNVAVLVNGRKINPATDGATLYLNSISLDNVAQIEVIEGSAGTLYGNQAVGGLINIITRRADRRSREIRMAAGSYQRREVSAAMTEPLTGGAGLHLLVERRDSDNYRDRNASRMQRFDGRLDFEDAAGDSYVDLQYLDDHVQTPGALFASELAADRRQAVFQNDYLATDSTVLRIGTRRELGPDWRFEGEVAIREDRREFVQSFRGFPGSLSTQDRDSFELTPRLIGKLNDSVVTLGIDLLSTDYLLLTAFGPQGNDQAISAWYGQLSHPLSTKLSLTAGLRHARVDNRINNNGTSVRLDDDVTVGSLGFVLRPQAAWRLFLRADQNYRFAKVDEHTNVPFGQPAGLDNQRGVSYETGAEFERDGTRVAVRAYELRLKDEISFDAATFTNVNLPRSRRRGATISVDSSPSAALSGGLGYAYIDSEITSGSHSGSQVPLVPEHRATAYLSYRPTHDWLARLDVEHVGRQFLGADFNNRAKPLGAYTVVNLVAHHDIGNWRITGKVNNLLDERYSETGASSFAGDGFNPAPERHFWLGASYRFEE
jgi:iron complex outermembrane receptor protein